MDAPEMCQERQIAGLDVPGTFQRRSWDVPVNCCSRTRDEGGPTTVSPIQSKSGKNNVTYPQVTN